MEMLTESFLITIIAAVISLSFSKLAIGEWWYPELSWKIVGIFFVVLALVFNFLYFLVIK